jgi:hypothetical protein
MPGDGDQGLIDVDWCLPCTIEAIEKHQQRMVKMLEGCEELGNGLPLRDYFAGQALAGLMGNSDFWCYKDTTPEDLASLLARAAYRQADAMLAEREK